MIIKSSHHVTLANLRYFHTSVIEYGEQRAPYLIYELSNNPLSFSFRIAYINHKINGVNVWLSHQLLPRCILTDLIKI